MLEQLSRCRKIRHWQAYLMKLEAKLSEPFLEITVVQGKINFNKLMSGGGPPTLVNFTPMYRGNE